MRITNQLITRNAIRHLSDNMNRLAVLQEKAASTKQFQAVSDDPANASAALTLRSSIATNESYLATAYHTDDWMTASELAFKQLDNAATLAISLVTRGLSDTMSDSDRKSTLGPEIDQILQQALDFANASHQGYYIFSGYRIDQKPFAVNGASIDYAGDSGIMNRELGPGVTLPVNINGSLAIQPLLSAIKTVRDALNPDPPTGPVDMTALRNGLDLLQNAQTVLDEYRAVNGSRQRQVKAAIDHLDSTQLELKNLLSKHEDANMAEAISMLKSQETTYQAALEVGQRAISMLNLFDVLR